MTLFRTYLIIAFGGALGAVSRWLLSTLVHQFMARDVPYGTMTVNITGCLLLGFLFALHETRGALSDDARMLLFIGFFGAFTTFSTYILETMLLIRGNAWVPAGLTFIAQNAIGFLAVVIGVRLGSIL